MIAFRGVVRFSVFQVRFRCVSAFFQGFLLVLVLYTYSCCQVAVGIFFSMTHRVVLL